MPQSEAPVFEPRFAGEGPFTLVGTMSGTSLDGLDLAQVVFWKEASTGPWQKRIESTHFISYAELLGRKNFLQPTPLRKRNAFKLPRHTATG